MKNATYRVEVLSEQAFESMEFEFTVELEDEDDETDILNEAIFRQVMNDLSIMPEFLYLEDEDEDF